MNLNTSVTIRRYQCNTKGCIHKLGYIRIDVTADVEADDAQKIKVRHVQIVGQTCLGPLLHVEELTSRERSFIGSAIRNAFQATKAAKS